MSLFPEINKEIVILKKQNQEKIDKLICISKEYRPSNGTEGYLFESTVCYGCKKIDKCLVLARLGGGYTKEVRKIKNEIFCIKHTYFKIDKFLVEGYHNAK